MCGERAMLGMARDEPAYTNCFLLTKEPLRCNCRVAPQTSELPRSILPEEAS